MNSKSLYRLIVTIAVIIVGLWLVLLAFKIAGWLLNILLPVAAVVLIVAVIMSWGRKSGASEAHPRKSKTLKISRDTSDNKKDSN
jgi:undecaprenyl pyrophosphate phosphatase UppP